MSRAVYLECLDCKCSRSDSVNHGEDALRKMWAAKDAVKAVNQSNGFCIEARCADTYSLGDWWTWIAAHAACRVHLVDEYGRSAPVEGTEDCDHHSFTLDGHGKWKLEMGRDLVKLGMALRAALREVEAELSKGKRDKYWAIGDA